MMHIRNAHVDARAPYRDRHAPSRLTIVQVPARPAIAAITDAVNAQPMPAVLVTASGKIWQLTAGGSGIVWVQSDGRFTAPQRNAIDDITAAFETEWPHLAKPANLTGTLTPTRESLDRMMGIAKEAETDETTVKAAPKKRRPRKKAAPKLDVEDRRPAIHAPIIPPWPIAD